MADSQFAPGAQGSQATRTTPGPGSATAPLVPTAAWPVRSGQVPPLADRFSARPETAPGIEGVLKPGTALAVVPAMAADGGQADWLRPCGKTQLAAFFAESQWRAQALDLLVWVDASSRASVLAGYAEAVAALTGAVAPESAETVAASLLGWLRRTDRRWLLVFDDLPDDEVLRGLWPAGRSGLMLVTARNQLAVAGLTHTRVVGLGQLSPREAMSYLVARLTADPDQRRGAMDLIADLAGEPLALAQATAVIGSSRITCDDYRERLMRRVPELGPPGQEPRHAAAVTWTLAVDRADQMLPGGGPQACLVLAALLDVHGIPEAVFSTPAVSGYVAGDLVPETQAAEHARAALQCLEQAGLVTVDRIAQPATAAMSTVLQQVIRAAAPADMRDSAGLAAAAGLLEMWPADASRACAVHGPFASADSLRRATAGLLWASGCHPLLMRAGRSLDEALLTGPAVEYWSDLAAISDRVLGPGHPDSMALVERLAVAYVAAGRSDDAIAWYRRLLVDWARAFGPQHVATLGARVRLGRALVAAGLPSEAVGVLSSVVADCEQAFGAEHPESQYARDELAAGYSAAGQLEQAIKLYQRSLADRERAAGPLDAGTIDIRGKLAGAYLKDGRMKDAISQYKRALSDCQRSRGADSPDTMRLLESLAAAYHLAGRMAIAVQTYEQAHAASARALGADHPDTIASALGLAGAYYAVGRISDAERLYREAIASAERALAPGHPLAKSARQGLTAITGE